MARVAPFSAHTTCSPAQLASSVVRRISSLARDSYRIPSSIADMLACRRERTAVEIRKESEIGRLPRMYRIQKKQGSAKPLANLALYG